MVRFIFSLKIDKFKYHKMLQSILVKTMKINHSLPHRVLIILTVLLTNCGTEEPSLTPQDKIIWQAMPELTSSLGYMNSHSFNTGLEILGTSSFYKNVIFEAPGTQSAFPLGMYAGSGRLKFPIGRNFYVLTDTDKIIVRSVAGTTTTSIEKMIDLKALDENFSQLIDIPYWQGECMAISQEDYLLVAYQAVQNNNVKSTPSFALLQIQAPLQNDGELNILSTRLIQNDIFPGATTVYRIQSFMNYFFVEMGPYTFRMDNQGKMEKVSDQRLNIFEYANTLYAFGYNLNSDSDEFYKSTNAGASWILLDELSLSTMAPMHFTSIDNKVVAYSVRHFITFEFSESSYTITQLDDEGLSTDYITSITLADNNCVVITMRCNELNDECGVYYKPLENFFEPKTND